MTDWLDAYATELLQELGGRGPEGVGDGVRESLLDLARIVAHGTERKNAPLATYLAGSFVAMRAVRGVDEDMALHEAVSIAQRLLSRSTD